MIEWVLLGVSGGLAAGVAFDLCRRFYVIFKEREIE